MSYRKVKTVTIERIIVLGAGAIGSIYGALVSAKKDTTLVGRKAHVEAIRTRGLRVTGEINQTFKVKADTEIRDVPPSTLLLLTTKAQDSVHALRQVKPLLKKDTVILVLQNGLGNEEAVRETLRSGIEVIRGLTTMAAEFLKPGEIKVWKGETILGKSRTSDEICALFNSCGLKTRVSENIRAEAWNKLVLNCVVNPLTALFRVPDCEIVSEPLRWVRHSIVQECIKVAEAEGVNINVDADEIDRKIQRYTNLSSMCQDIIKKKKTEIDFLNGKIVELGLKHGIPTPVNQTLTCLIRFLEERLG